MGIGRAIRVGTTVVLGVGLVSAVPASGAHRQGPASAPASAATSCIVPGKKKPLDQIWHPDMSAALKYEQTRTNGGQADIEFAARMDGHFWGYRSNHQEWSASVVKAMLLVAYVDQHVRANRELNDHEKSLLRPMITHSDDYAADQVFNQVHESGLRALAQRVGMTHFVPNQIWGRSYITASDQTKFFLHIDRFTVPQHRAYALLLLKSITPSQRWGIGKIQLPGWNVYFKGGWGAGTGLMDHQVVLLTRGCARVSLAVLTMHDADHTAGKNTLRGIFWRMLFGFPRFRHQ